MTGFSRSSAAIWKGLAIWMVVLVHFLAVFPESLYFNPLTAWWSLPFQSLVRFSVPLFLALSGYGLAKKYQHIQMSWREFLKNRLLKLLPAYLLWSLIVWASLEIFPNWRVMPRDPLWKQLLLGTADYQLYFVPLILQLYAIFPLIHRLKKRKLLLLTAIALTGQVALAILLRLSWFNPGLLPSAWLSDQIQYRLPFNWWGYFLLGVVLADQKSFISGVKKYANVWLLTMTIFLVWATYDSYLLLHSTNSVIFATSFLRTPIIFFATTFILWATSISWHKLQSNPICQFLQKSGQRSYFIYLSHTSWLRILFSLL